MDQETQDSIRNYLLSMAEDFIPDGAEIVDAKILPKTTLELRWFAPSENRRYWLVIEYKHEGEKLRARVSVS